MDRLGEGYTEEEIELAVRLARALKIDPCNTHGPLDEIRRVGPREGISSERINHIIAVVVAALQAKGIDLKIIETYEAKNASAIGMDMPATQAPPGAEATA